MNLFLETAILPTNLIYEKVNDDNFNIDTLDSFSSTNLSNLNNQAIELQKFID